MMIAHSLKGEVFGPAQQVHGATYVVDVEFRRPSLDQNGIVVDMGRAGETIGRILGDLSYRNLDDEEWCRGRNTTTEVLAREIFDRVCGAIAHGDLGADAQAIAALRVSLAESHVASAAYEGPVAP